MNEIRRAIVLLSGGIDSTTTVAIAKAQGFRCFALTFDYGQRNKWEIAAAKNIASSMRLEEHKVLQIDLTAIGGSPIVDTTLIPKNRTASQISSGIPVTYVPSRNTIFLSFALAWAEVVESTDIFIGVNVIDYYGYPDCRPEFIEAFQRLASLATKAGVQRNAKFNIHTPLIRMTKAEIIRKGSELGLDFSITQSCYDPTPRGEACGICDACVIRLGAFREVGAIDPGKYSR